MENVESDYEKKQKEYLNKNDFQSLNISKVSNFPVHYYRERFFIKRKPKK